MRKEAVLKTALVVSLLLNALGLAVALTPLRFYVKAFLQPTTVPVYALVNFDFHWRPESNDPTAAVIGDSIVQQMDLAALLGRSDVVNRGIAGDLSVDMPKRLKFLLGKKPKVLVIQGGINDIMSRIPVERIVKSKMEMIAFCEKEGIVPVLVQTLRVAKAGPAELQMNREAINAKVLELNTAMAAAAKESRIKLVDVAEAASENGFLRSGLTSDGIHLNQQGEALLAGAIGRALSGADR
jgi:lysophospholipase L1-like esterase